MNLDNISTNDIFKSFSKQAIDFDEREFDKMMYKKYPKELDRYEFISPSQVSCRIMLGDVIKFTKKNSMTISCASIVKKIQYTNESQNNSKIIDFMFLSTDEKDHIWKIYIANHFIFKLMPYDTLTRSRTEFYDKIVTSLQNKKSKMVFISPKLKKEIVSKCFDKKYDDIDYVCEKIFNNYDVGKK